jgi:hypothetical protein
MRAIRLGTLTGLLFGLGMLAIPSRVEAAGCEQQVCPSEGEWLDGETLGSKARKKDAKANKKRPDVELSVVFAGERGSVFVDGRYLAPDATRAIKPGKHEIEVRDGDEVIALGVLVVPRGVDSVRVEVGAGS